MKIELPFEFGDWVYVVTEQTEYTNYEPCEHCGMIKPIAHSRYIVVRMIVDYVGSDGEEININLYDETNVQETLYAVHPDMVFVKLKDARAKCKELSANA
jgi:hypothetical protein